jgi:hypothetical protein
MLIISLSTAQVISEGFFGYLITSRMLSSNVTGGMKLLRLDFLAQFHGSAPMKALHLRSVRNWISPKLSPVRKAKVELVLRYIIFGLFHCYTKGRYRKETGYDRRHAWHAPQAMPRAHP